METMEAARTRSCTTPGFEERTFILQVPGRQGVTPALRLAPGLRCLALMPQAGPGVQPALEYTEDGVSWRDLPIPEPDSGGVLWVMAPNERAPDDGEPFTTLPQPTGYVRLRWSAAGETAPGTVEVVAVYRVPDVRQSAAAGGRGAPPPLLPAAARTH